MSGRPSFKEMSDVAQCILNKVKCRTTKEAKTQATHQRVALFMGLGCAKRMNQQIKTPSDEPVGAQQLKRPRSTEQPHFRWSEASTLFNRWRKPQKGGRDDFTRQTTIQKTDELLKEPTHRNH